MSTRTIPSTGSSKPLAQRMWEALRERSSRFTRLAGGLLSSELVSGKRRSSSSLNAPCRMPNRALGIVPCRVDRMRRA